MKGGSARHILTGLIAVGALLAPGFASAATLFLSPSDGPASVGRVFPVAVKVNTQGIAVNAAEGTLAFDPAVLRVVSVSNNSSIFNLNVENPTFSNATGTIRWAGVILNPGYTGASGNLLTINFEGVKPGQTGVAFTAGAVLANDGKGTNVLDGMSDGTYAVGTATETPTPAAPASAAAPYEVSSARPLMGNLLRILALLAILLGLWFLIAAWRRRRRHALALASVRRDVRKESDQLEHIIHDMADEIALLNRIAKNRPLYPEEKYLRSKMVQYSRAMKSHLADTHRRLSKKK